MAVIELLGGVKLPSPKPLSPFKFEEGLSRYQKNKLRQNLWIESYDFCLVYLHKLGDDPLHKVFVHMSDALAKEVPYCNDSKAVALRFLGEMEVAKYIKFKTVGRKFTELQERKLFLKDKLVKLNIAEILDNTGAIKYPSEEQDTTYEVRRGINSNVNKSKVKVVKDISSERFEINLFMLGLLGKVPPTIKDISMELAFKRTMGSAQAFIGKVFNFPYFLDSRSRKYTATTAGFSPQGADHEKALVLPMFREKLSEKGFEALLEATFGYSEIEWTPQEIANHAKNPVATQEEWKKADKPYCYMACADLVRQYLNDPEIELPSFTPLDGRCSGLQHWSALLRTNSIVKHIGMHKVEADRDIYERVADDWKKLLEPQFQYIATRKVCKIPVMTFAYMATRMTSQEWLNGLYGEKTKWNYDKEEFEVVEEGLEYATTMRLGSELYDGLNITLKDLTVAMEWLGSSARVIAKAGNTQIVWTTPDDFQCTQYKVKGKSLGQKVILSTGDTFEISYMDYSEKKPHASKHATAIAPNVIHSLDATHVRMVARELKKLGLPMIFIHDSFATHSNYRDILYQTIVDTFIELYSGDYLLELKGYWEEKYEVELPDLPIRGLWEPKSLKKLKLFFK